MSTKFKPLLASKPNSTGHFEIEYSGHPYVRSCKCGKEHCLYTQRDNDPEYYTTVRLRCDCGELVVFSLPVN